MVSRVRAPVNRGDTLTEVASPANVRPAMTRWSARVMTALGLLVLLAATAGSPPAPSLAPGATVAIRLNDAVGMVVLGLFAVSILLFFSLQRRRRPEGDEEPGEHDDSLPRRRSALFASLPFVLLLVALVYLVWTRWAPGAAHPLHAPLAALTGLLEMLALAQKPPTSLPLFDYAIAGLILALALASCGLMLLLVFADRLVRWLHHPRPGRAEALGTAAAQSLEDLRADPDARAAIIRAYRRFELALAAVRVVRPVWQTPSEFMRATLDEAAVPAAAVERLTALFEVARFSDHALGPDARDAAYGCLDAVRAALARGGGDAR
jgi:hypothetical protein